MFENKHPDVCMIVHNSLVHDARVLREANSLTQYGWSVIVLAITPDRHDLPSIEVVKGFTICRISLPSSYCQLSDFLSNRISEYQKQESIDREDNSAKSWHKLKYRIKKVLHKFFFSIHRFLLSDDSIVAIVLVLLRGAYFIRSVNARIYHAHDFPALLHVAIAGIWNRPIIYDSHELFFDQWYPNESPRLYRNLRPWEKYLAKRASVMITVGEMVADRLAETLDVNRPVVIFNTVDLRTVQPSYTFYDTGKRRTIVHSGALNFGRHLPELLSSLLYLPEDVVLVLMGDGILKNRLELQAKELNIEERVIFVPPVLPDNIASTLAQADIGAVLITDQSVHYDYSMPNKLFECIAAGLPIIVSQCKEISALTRKYELGVICNPSQPTDIAAGIIKILEPQNLLRYKHNVCNARDSFLNWENEERKLVDIYQRLTKDCPIV
jgi:glycosyltransferase involved in cell wall biosynthesis